MRRVVGVWFPVRIADSCDLFVSLSREKVQRTNIDDGYSCEGNVENYVKGMLDCMSKGHAKINVFKLNLPNFTDRFWISHVYG